MFKSKKNILEKAAAVLAAERAQAIDELNTLINEALSESERKASLGEEPFPTTYMPVPPFFIGVKGFAEMPKELEQELAEAGYLLELDGNRFRLR